MADTQLELWLSRNRKRFWSPTIDLTWRAVFDDYHSNGGRMGEAFIPACKLLGFTVRPIAKGGYVLCRGSKVKP